MSIWHTKERFSQFIFLPGSKMTQSLRHRLLLLVGKAHFPQNVEPASLECLSLANENKQDLIVCKDGYAYCARKRKAF